MKKYFSITALLVLCLTLLSGCDYMNAMFASSKMANYRSAYGIEKGCAAIIVDGELLEENGLVIDDTLYIPEAVLRSHVSKSFYWDGHSDKLFYTNAEKVHEMSVRDPKCGHVEGEELYISLSCVEKYLDVQVTVYEEPSRVFIDTAGSVRRMTTMAKKSDVRVKGGYKSDVLTKAAKGDLVQLLAEHETWAQIRTEDGHLGYVTLSTLNMDDVKEETLELTLKNPAYKRLTMEGPICIAWQDMESTYGNYLYDEMIANTKGVTVYSPTWIALSDNDGHFKSYCDSDIVDKAHAQGMQVWVLADDLYPDMSVGQVLTNNKVRKRLVKNMVKEVKACGADGINIDFEFITDSCGKDFIQFLRELKLRCVKENLILSVDNANPTFVKYCYDMKEQGTIADYVVLMGYDEHWVGSEAGSVSSIDFVKGGIDAALSMVPAEKIISGLPFYCRIWTETPEQYAEPGVDIRDDGNSEFSRYALDSVAVSMSQARSVIEKSGYSPEWNDNYGQYYVKIPTEHGVQRIWLEDLKSLQVKLDLVSSYNLAGLAFWRLGMEDAEAWDEVSNFFNK